VSAGYQPKPGPGGPLQHPPRFSSTFAQAPFPLRNLCEALGWQGGTVHQAIAEVKALRNQRDELAAALRLADERLLARMHTDSKEDVDAHAAASAALAKVPA